MRPNRSEAGTHEPGPARDGVIYRIALDSPQGRRVMAAEVPDVAAAYDLCRERLQQSPDASTGRIYVNDILIHTMRRRP